MGYQVRLHVNLWRYLEYFILNCSLIKGEDGWSIGVCEGSALLSDPTSESGCQCIGRGSGQSHWGGSPESQCNKAGIPWWNSQRSSSDCK